MSLALNLAFRKVGLSASFGDTHPTNSPPVSSLALLRSVHFKNLDTL